MLESGDFLRIEYTGYDEKGKIFDSTVGEVSKKIRGTNGPILIVYGFGQLLYGIEESIKNVEEGKNYELAIPPEKAFGNKKKSLVHVMKPDEFRKNNLVPRAGLVIHADFEDKKLIGTIKSVTSGRVMVDFNHPLAGQKLKYIIKILEIIKDPRKKAEALISEFGFDVKNLSLEKRVLTFSLEDKLNNKNNKDDGKVDDGNHEDDGKTDNKNNKDDGKVDDGNHEDDGKTESIKANNEKNTSLRVDDRKKALFKSLKLYIPEIKEIKG